MNNKTSYFIYLKCLMWVTLALMFSACSSTSLRSGSSENTLDIYEAAFTYYFSSHFSQDAADMDYIFLRTHLQDPPPELLSRLSQHTPAVVPFSSATFSPTHGIVHAGNPDNRGIVFSISKIKWISKHLVTVECENTSTRYGISGGKMKLKNERGQWRVISHSLVWIN